MLFFDKRRKLAKRYFDWIKENNFTDHPVNVIAFLVVHGLLDEDKVLKFLENEK